MRAVALVAVLLAGCGKDRPDAALERPAATEARPAPKAKPVHSDKPVAKEATPVKAYPTELIEDYQNNPARADVKYKGKVVEIEMPWLMHREGSKTVVRSGRIVYRFVSEGEAAKVEPGRFHLVRGKCDGLVGGSIVISSVRIVGIIQ